MDLVTKTDELSVAEFVTAFHAFFFLTDLSVAKESILQFYNSTIFYICIAAGFLSWPGRYGLGFRLALYMARE